MLMCLTLIPAVARAGPTPEQSIAVIERIAEGAAAAIEGLTDSYYSYLNGNPSQSQALSQLNQAISDMMAEAANAESDIADKMKQHLTSQEVQDAGNDAIANVWDTATTESAAITAAYNAYIGGATTTPALPAATTTTLPTVTTTTLPTVTTTTTTTTLAGSTTTSITAISGGAAGPKTTTTTPTTTTPTTTTTVPDLVAAAPPLPPKPPLSTAALASRLGTMASGSTAQPLTVTRVAASGTDSPGGIGSVLELVRISLPAAVMDPIIDVFIVLQAMAAAFVSGVLALAWPAAALLLVVLVQAARRWGPSRLKSAPSTALFDSMG